VKGQGRGTVAAGGSRAALRTPNPNNLLLEWQLRRS